jgi:tRNA A-37 threonylcarbamoyl transferase component Bud32
MEHGGAEQIGEWVVVSALGRDELGTFYHVRHIDAPAHRATLLVLHDVDHVAFRRLREMVVRLQAHSHPRVARLRRVGKLDRRVLVEFSSVEGRLLSELRLEGERRAAVLDRIAEAVSWLHRCGLAHGALRASTVVVDEHNTVTLLAVGLGVLHELQEVPELVRADLRELGRLVLPWSDEELSEASGEDATPDSQRGASEGAPGRSSPRRSEREGVPARIGPYVPIEELGRGGMGIVYRARDPAKRREVAVKVLNDAAGPTRRARFAREVAALAMVRHPAVVRILENGIDHEVPYFAMRLVLGPSLRSELVRRGTLEPAEAVRLVERVARGLHVAHSLGIVHRDVKPENILLDDSEPVLTDFGLAVGTGEDEVRLTDGGQGLGTLGYMAPEQLRGEVGTIGPATDVFALGAVLHELITGRVTPDSSSHATLGRLLADVHACATAPRVADRYPSASAFADDLELVLRGGIPAASRGAWRRWGRTQSRTMLLAAVVGLLSALGSVGGVTWWNRYAEQQEAIDRAVAATRRGAALQAGVDDLLARGERQSAEDMFRLFLVSEGAEGGAAQATAWLRRAVQFEQWGDPSPRESYLEALAVPLTPRQRRLALREVMALDAGAWDWSSLAAAIEAMARSGDQVEPAMRRELALADRAFAEAAVWSGEPSATRMLSRFGAAWRVPRQAHTVLVVPGEAPALLFMEPGKASAQVLWLRGAGAKAETLPVPPALRGFDLLQPVGVLDDGAPGLLAYDAELRQGALVAVGQGALTVRLSWTSDRWTGGALTDMDGDGRNELYVAIGPYERRLRRFVQEAGGWIEAAPALDLDPARSDVSAVASGDLDADGREELIVASGPWFAYDLRRLTLGELGFETQSRWRPGAVVGLATGWGAGDRPVVRAMKIDRYGSPARLGAERPSGVLPGVYTLGVSGGGWEVLAHHALPGALDGRSAGGDYDGDGLQDLAVGLRSPDDKQEATVVLLRSSQGADVPVSLYGMRLLGALDAEGDGKMELVVRRDDLPEVWVLGVGDGPMPLKERPDAHAEPPEGVGAPIGEVWSRSEEIATLGGGTIASEHLARAAREAAGDPQRVPAMRRAAELAAADGAWAQAGELYLEVAGWWGAQPSRDLLAAAEAFERAHDMPRALEAIGAIGGTPEAVEGGAALALREARLRAWVDRPWVRGQFDEPLHPAWVVGEPGRVERGGPTGTLTVEVVDAHRSQTLLHMPVQLDGDTLSMRLDLDVARIEWASGLDLVLSTPNAAAIGLGVMSSGGGGQFDLLAGCTRDPERPDGAVAAQPTPSTPHRVQLRLEASWDEGTLWCESVIDGVRDERVFELPGNPSPSLTGRLELRSRGWLAGPGVVRSELVLRALEVGGVRAVGAEQGRPDVGRLLAEGRLTEPADLVDPGSLVAPLVFLEAGRTAEARAALANQIAKLPEGATLPTSLITPIRSRPARWVGMLRELLRPAAFHAAVLRAWANTAAMHGRVGDTELDRFFTSRLEDLTTADPLGDDPWTHDVVALLRIRADVWRLRHQPEEAGADLRRAIELATRGALPAAVQADLELEAACLAAELGEDDAAFVHLERAVALAPGRGLFFDLLEVRDELARLKGQARWAGLARSANP